MAAAEPLRPALVASVVLHAALLALAIFLGMHSAVRKATSSAEGSAAWAGDTLDIDELVPSTAQPGGAAEAPNTPAPAALPAPKPEAPPEARAAAATELVPVKKPRAHAKRAETPPASASSAPPAALGASSTGSESSASSASAESAGADHAGTSGEAPGVANLAKAFTKAVTAATSRDPLWDELPLGVVGSARVVIRVDDEGHITSSALDDREHVAEPLRRLVERTLLLLQAGRFAIDKGELHAGAQKLRIQVTLRAGEPAEDYDDPHHNVTLGFDPPSATVPGKAYFVHASGRSFEARVWIEDGA